jgi:glycosyltransferase involved in cell wall biosynthesis
MRWLLNVTIVSITPSGRRNELRRFGQNSRVIPNWYDSRRYIVPSPSARARTRRALQFAEDTCVLISLGGNEPPKNYRLIVQALALVPSEVSVLYVQIGNQGHGRPLELEAVRLGVAERLRCAGMVLDPSPYLWAADALIAPSSEEGCPVAVLEAMATGLPVILADVESLCDFRQTVEGVMYIPPEPEAIAKAMTTMSTKPLAERRLRGEKAARTVARHYGLDTGPRQYLALYRRGVYGQVRRGHDAKESGAPEARISDASLGLRFRRFGRETRKLCGLATVRRQR